MHGVSKSLILCVLILLVFTLTLGACVATVKPIYYKSEQAKAESAVDHFHKLHNDGRFEEIYALLDDATRAAITKDQFFVAAKQTFDEWGKVLGASLSEAKVFPSSPIQVKMIYNVRFEKGDGQEWFTWNIQGKDVRLFQYQTKPGLDRPSSQ
jgi:hypothetical protein